MIKSFTLHHNGANFGAHSVLRETALDGDETICLLDALDDSVFVEWSNGTKIYDLNGKGIKEKIHWYL